MCLPATPTQQPHPLISHTHSLVTPTHFITSSKIFFPTFPWISLTASLYRGNYHGNKGAVINQVSNNTRASVLHTQWVLFELLSKLYMAATSSWYANDCLIVVMPLRKADTNSLWDNNGRVTVSGKPDRCSYFPHRMWGVHHSVMTLAARISSPLIIDYHLGQLT